MSTKIVAQHCTPIINVSSMEASFAWFARLGWDKRWDWGSPPDFGCVGSGGVEIFLCLNGQGGRWRDGPLPDPDSSRVDQDGVWLGIFVDDVDGLYALCLEQGIDVIMAPRDQPWHLRETIIRHPDGHCFRFGRPIRAEDAHAEEPLVIERVDVPVRLEKRLAALLRDLAAVKGVSVSSALEEILLHTNDGVGPHTGAELAAIDELKRTHGIDYDTHGSYRFVERPE